MSLPSNPKIIAVAAQSENGIISKAGGIPWRVKGDMKFWTQQARGRPVIMGRKTYESMPPAFKKRTDIIIITRDDEYTAENAEICYGFDDALQAAREICAARDIDTIVVGGGGEIYRQALPYLDAMYLTTIHCRVEDGDARFPEFDETEWQTDGPPQEFSAEPGDTCGYTIRKYVRS